MTQTEKQNIEVLSSRYQKLHNQKIEAETNLKNAMQQLEELKSQALQEFETDDIQQLKQKLEEMEAENERHRSEYQASLDQIESELASVQRKYNDTQAESGT